jgi:hypothetical protein
MNWHRVLSLLLLTMAGAMGGAFWLQREEASRWREEVAWLRAERSKLAGLRAEKARLAAEQPSDAALATLRADREAVVRLRTEIGRLRREIEERERKLVGASGR